MNNSKNLYYKKNIEIKKTGSLLEIRACSRRPTFSIKDFKKALSHISIRYGSSYLLKTYDIPYCLFPKNIIYKNIYYQNENTETVKPPECKNCKFFQYCPGIPIEFMNSTHDNFEPITERLLEISIEVSIVSP